MMMNAMMMMPSSSCSPEEREKRKKSEESQVLHLKNVKNTQKICRLAHFFRSSLLITTPREEVNEEDFCKTLLRLRVLARVSREKARGARQRN